MSPAATRPDRTDAWRRGVRGGVSGPGDREGVSGGGDREGVSGPGDRSSARQAGSAGLLTVLATGLVASLGCAAVVAATDAGLAAAKARTAADAAALAAVGASPLVGGDGDARAAAEALAAANDAEVVACCEPEAATGTDGGSPVVRARVVVSVRPRLALVRAAATGLRSAAVAAARPLPGALDMGRAAGRGSRAGAPPGGGDGPLSSPVGGALLTSGFGWRTHPITGMARRHTGADFAAARGTAVDAAAGGVVVSAGWRGGYGRTVEVNHGNGRTTLYAHLSWTAVTPGELVARGQRLGVAGSTGQSTGPHLHFEVRIDGQPVDPLGHLH